MFLRVHHRGVAVAVLHALGHLDGFVDVRNANERDDRHQKLDLHERMRFLDFAEDDADVVADVTPICFENDGGVFADEILVRIFSAAFPVDDDFLELADLVRVEQDSRRASAACA